MEVDEIHCKFPRISSNGDGKLAHGHNNNNNNKMDDGEEEDGENKRLASASASAAALRGGPVDLGGGLGRFYGWPSSRIVRVSRASGGKDRHSKVLTSKGLRDRRVRLSVNTAIQFYDLQDRLGYDQPSKAVEWLLKAAAASIDELPPMNSPFPDTPKQLSDEKRSSTAGSDQFGFDSADAAAGEPNFSHPQVTKSSAACSSTSETSKGSGLSLSRSESRIKARERAKGRVAEKEKEKENESSHVAGSINHISQTTSFTELLSGGINNGGNNNGAGDGNNNTNESNFFLKSSPRHWSSTPMDYFTSGLLGQTSARSGQMNPFTSPLFSVSTDHHHHQHHQHHHPELQQFSFVSEMSNNNQNHDGGGGGGDYNLNFSISSSSANSSGLAGYNRGTLQSNSSPPQSSSPSLLPHQLQRFNSDGSPQGFYIGTTAPVENHHHQYQSGYDARLQLCYGDRQSQSASQKGKGKN